MASTHIKLQYLLPFCERKKNNKTIYCNFFIYYKSKFILEIASDEFNDICILQILSVNFLTVSNFHNKHCIKANCFYWKLQLFHYFSRKYVSKLVECTEPKMKTYIVTTTVCSDCSDRKFALFHSFLGNSFKKSNMVISQMSYEH